MTAGYAAHFSTLRTPQSEKAKPAQVANYAGGFVFQLEPRKQLERWLVLGSAGATYYTSAQKLTRENAQVVISCLDADGPGTVETIASMSESGRAPKNDPAIFALAIACGHSDLSTRQLALAALPRVCRTGTHLFQFVDAIRNFRGWGRGLKSAVAQWYASKTPADLAYQVAKYQQREGWSHRDVFRLASPVPDAAHAAIYRYIATGATGFAEGVTRREVKRKDREPVVYENATDLPAFLVAFEELKRADAKRTVELIAEHGFTHEMVNTEHLKSPEVWAALLEKMPMTAMIRSLARMTAIGLLQPMSAASAVVCERLVDAARLKKARVHPIQVLSALLTYRAGRGEKGSLTWQPVPQVIDALDAGFYEAFGALEPSGKRTLLAVDVSGSMSSGEIAGVPGLTPRSAAAVMAMVTARVEKRFHVVAFGHQLRYLTVTPRMRLDDVVATLDGWDGGRTDCALPMLACAHEGIPVDCFNIYTDNETWCGQVHPFQALRDYRTKSGIPDARLATVAFTATGFSIADPSDPGMLDVVGFDSAAPQVLADFARQ